MTGSIGYWGGQERDRLSHPGDDLVAFDMEDETRGEAEIERHGAGGVVWQVRGQGGTGHED